MTLECYTSAAGAGQTRSPSCLEPLLGFPEGCRLGFKWMKRPSVGAGGVSLGRLDEGRSCLSLCHVSGPWGHCLGKSLCLVYWCFYHWVSGLLRDLTGLLGSYFGFCALAPTLGCLLVPGQMSVLGATGEAKGDAPLLAALPSSPTEACLPGEVNRQRELASTGVTSENELHCYLNFECMFIHFTELPTCSGTKHNQL